MITKFRGKSMLSLKDLINAGIRYKGDGWVEGYLIQEGKDSYIISGVIEANSQYIVIAEWIPVFTDSVGRFTGLQDKNFVDIYEGDNLKGEQNIAKGVVSIPTFRSGIVKYSEKNTMFYLDDGSKSHDLFISLGGDIYTYEIMNHLD